MRILILLSVIALMGCQPKKQAPHHWQAKGNVLLKTVHKQQRLNFIWRHTPTMDTLTLMDRFGLEALTFSHDIDHPWHSTDRTLSRNDIEQRLGYALPLEALPKWLNAQAVSTPPWEVKLTKSIIVQGQKHAQILDITGPKVSAHLTIRHWS